MLLSHERCVYHFGDGTRLGDQLITYIKAKWISYSNNTPLYIKPNKYFDPFMISKLEKFSQNPPFAGKRKAGRLFVDLDKYKLQEDTSFFIPFYKLMSDVEFYELKEIQEFRKEIRKMIAPLDPIDLIFPPQGVQSIALHIRSGRGFDRPRLGEDYFDLSEKQTFEPDFVPIMRKRYSDLGFPGRFLPEKFYGDAVKFLSKYLNHPSLYVYIFTDDPNPEDIKNRLIHYVGLDNVIFNSRKGEGGSKINVIEDFFSITNFDYLIRPRKSHFSQVAEFISDHKIVLSSSAQHWVKDAEDKYYLIIDDINLRAEKIITNYKWLKKSIYDE